MASELGKARRHVVEGRTIEERDRAVTRYHWAVRQEVCDEIEGTLLDLRDQYKDELIHVVLDLARTKLRQEVLDGLADMQAEGAL